MKQGESNRIYSFNFFLAVPAQLPSLLMRFVSAWVFSEHQGAVPRDGTSQILSVNPFSFCT